MRILCLNYTDFFRLNFSCVFESIGHQVYHLDKITEDTMNDAIRIFQPEAAVDMGWDAVHVPGQISILRNFAKNHGIYRVYFADEDWFHFYDWSKRYVQLSSPDFVFTRSPSCIMQYEKLGIKSAYLDVGSNAIIHRPVAPDPAFACDVVVIANAQLGYDIFRRKSIGDLVVPLFDQSYQTMIWGRGWGQATEVFGRSPAPQMIRGMVPYHKTAKLYNSAKISISIQTVEDQLSNRTYDILSSGGFMLTSDTQAVREKLTPGVHCEVSGSPEETLEKISYYLANEGARLRIAKAGYELAREHFVFQKTMPEAWSLVEREIANRRQ